MSASVPGSIPKLSEESKDYFGILYREKMV